MACFAAPAAVGILTTVFRKKIPEKYHIKWLNTMLWGGVIGLALEHVAHQEIVSYFPYLTAMASPADTAVMFHEILTVGVGMTVACIAAWIVMLKAYSILEAKNRDASKQTA